MRTTEDHVGNRRKNRCGPAVPVAAPVPHQFRRSGGSSSNELAPLAIRPGQIDQAASRLPGREGQDSGIDRSRPAGSVSESRDWMREDGRMFYNARSAMIHSRSDQATPFTNDAAFIKGFKLARMWLFKLLRESAPDDGERRAVADAPTAKGSVGGDGGERVRILRSTALCAGGSATWWDGSRGTSVCRWWRPP